YLQQRSRATRGVRTRACRVEIRLDARPPSMTRFKGIRDFDWAMFAVVLAICGLGVLQIYSATHDTVFQGSWWKQVVYVAFGIGLMWVLANLDYHALMSRVYPMYIVTVILLLVVLLIVKRTFAS